MDTTQVTTKPLAYLDRAMMALKDLGVVTQPAADAPITGLLNVITGLDEGRVALIARTLTQASTFNEVVRNEVGGMSVASRYEEITKGFNSIRDDAKGMVDQLSDGKLDIFERASNVWQKVSRGDIATRFDKIKEVYVDVTKDTKDQIEREGRILEAYRDFRGAMKESEVLSLEVLKTAEGKLAEAKAKVDAAINAVEAAATAEPAARARLELARDEAVRGLQDEEKRYQIAKDLSDNLTVSYNTSEVVMARLMQTTNAKERVYQQSVAFFTTNESVLTALTASYTGLAGLHESTETLNAMKDGMSKSLETLAEIGGKVQEAALKAGYGPTVQAASVKKLVDSVVSYQERSIEIIAEMRTQATRNSEEIRDAVEDGKKRMARLASQGNALVMPGG